MYETKITIDKGGKSTDVPLVFSFGTLMLMEEDGIDALGLIQGGEKKIFTALFCACYYGSKTFTEIQKYEALKKGEDPGKIEGVSREDINLWLNGGNALSKKGSDVVTLFYKSINSLLKPENPAKKALDDNAKKK